MAILAIASHRVDANADCSRAATLSIQSANRHMDVPALAQRERAV
jgi:hypothetical protein